MLDGRFLCSVGVDHRLTLLTSELRQRRGIKIDTNVDTTCPEDDVNNLEGYYSLAAVSFLVQLAVMVFVAKCIMHVQVSTRFLSVCPPTYWYAAHAIKYSANRLPTGCIIWTYCLSYFGLSSLLTISIHLLDIS